MEQIVHHLLNPPAWTAGTAKFIPLWLTQVEYQSQHKLLEPILRLCLVLVLIQHQQHTLTLNIIMLIMLGSCPEAVVTAHEFMKAASTLALTSAFIHPVQFLMLRMMVLM